MDWLAEESQGSFHGLRACRSGEQVATSRRDHRRSCIAHKQYEPAVLQDLPQHEFLGVELRRLTRIRESRQQSTLLVG